MHYWSNGIEATKPTLVFLHGFGETSDMWKPLFPVFKRKYNVLAFDLPGSGSSPDLTLGQGQYTKMNLAFILHEKLQCLIGETPIALVGHDIGMMVAYAYAQLYPELVAKLVLMDAFLPGVAGWEEIYDDPKTWHFRFTDSTAYQLVQGHERTYLDHFWNDLAADPQRSISEKYRAKYTKAYRSHIQAQMEYFSSFLQDAQDNAAFGALADQIPVLVITGQRSSNEKLIQQVESVSRNVRGIILARTGHWLMEENLLGTLRALQAFLGRE